jgi:hypothetical protein
MESIPSAWALDAVWRQWAALWIVQICRRSSSECAFHAELFDACGEYAVCLGFGCRLAAVGSFVVCTVSQKIQFRTGISCRSVKRVWRVYPLPGLWMQFGDNGQPCGLYRFAGDPAQSVLSMQNCSTHVESMPSAWALDAVWRQWAALWSVQFRRKSSSEQAFLAELFGACGEYALCKGSSCCVVAWCNCMTCTVSQKIQFRTGISCRSVKRVWRVYPLQGVQLLCGGLVQLHDLHSFADELVRMCIPCRTADCRGTDVIR